MPRFRIDDLPVPRPDWVMLGIQAPDGEGVWLLASKQLTHAQLSMEVDRDDLYSGVGLVGSVTTSQRYELTAEMGTFVLIIAASYAEAFSRLWEQWRPDDYRTRPAAGEIGGRPALPAATPVPLPGTGRLALPG